MPTAPKRAENQSKHLTKTEIEAITAAEQDVFPDREPVELDKPAKMIKGNKAAIDYWKAIVSRMSGLKILDDLDCEILAVYCSMLARYDKTAALRKKLDKVNFSQMSGNEWNKFLSAILGLDAKQQALEKNLLTYAEKLGLTPTGRARLAAKRVDAIEADPYDDLFGD